MKLLRLAVVFLVLITTLITASATETYVYWFPFVDNSPAPYYSAFSSAIDVSAVYNGTTVYIDENYNGKLDAGESYLELSAGETQSFKNPPEGKAVKIVSNKPVQIYYRYSSNDWGAYDDNDYRYSPTPLGTKFVVPFSVGTVYIAATKDNTMISINGSIINLNTGDLYSAPALSGMIIISDKPIGVVLINNDKMSQDSSFATPIYSTSYFGTDFWIPPKFDLMYENVQADNRVIYIVYEDGKVDKISQPSEVTHYTTSSPAMLYYFFDVYAEDPWDGMRHYMHAHPIPPSSVLGKEYVVGYHLISTHDNNIVQIDSDYDGIFDLRVVLNAGEEYNPPQRRTGTEHPILYVEKLGHVKATYPLLNRYTHIGNWVYTDECTFSYLCNWVGFGSSYEISPSVSISTDKTNYTLGEVVKLSISISGGESPITVKFKLEHEGPEGLETIYESKAFTLPPDVTVPLSVNFPIPMSPFVAGGLHSFIASLEDLNGTVIAKDFAQFYIDDSYKVKALKMS